MGISLERGKEREMGAPPGPLVGKVKQRGLRAGNEAGWPG